MVLAAATEGDYSRSDEGEAGKNSKGITREIRTDSLNLRRGGRILLGYIYVCKIKITETFKAPRKIGKIGSNTGRENWNLRQS